MSKKGPEISEFGLWLVAQAHSALAATPKFRTLPAPRRAGKFRVTHRTVAHTAVALNLGCRASCCDPVIY
jgi:hypothetical protein